MSKRIKWTEISDNNKIIIGTLIQGYTYSVGDYHNNPKKVPKKFLGNSKLRTGIVIEVFSNKVFKVQFRNSAALKSKFVMKSNVINYGFQNSEQKGTIHGTDAYCILLQRKQITHVSKKQAYIINDIQHLQNEILSKHSQSKKRTIKYVKSTKFKKGFLSKDQIDKIFEEWQFTKREKELTHEKAWEKISLLKVRHNAKKCVENEYKKIQNAHKFLEKAKISSNEDSDYQKFLDSALKEYNTSKSTKKLKKTNKLDNEIEF